MTSTGPSPAERPVLAGAPLGRPSHVLVVDDELEIRGYLWPPRAGAVSGTGKPSLRVIEHLTHLAGQGRRRKGLRDTEKRWKHEGPRVRRGLGSGTGQARPDA